MFKTELFDKILETMPASTEKAKLVFIFALIDGCVSNELSDEDFLSDIKNLLKNL